MGRGRARNRGGDLLSGERTGQLLLGALPLACLLALWHGIAAAGLAPAALLPSPSAVAARLFEQLRNPLFLAHTATTLIRLFAGFAIAVVVGVTLGLAAASNRRAEALIRPLWRVLAPVPKIALYPALVLLLGFEHASKVALVVADAVFPILLATYQGAAAVEPKLVWSARAAGASRNRALLTVVLPAALPTILTGARIGLVISAIVVFLAEMLTSTDGLGHLLIYASRTFHTVDMFVPLITISITGLMLNAGFNALRKRLLMGFPDEP
jgi:ABC-type nitrate/sulfonate/bicarbonate transport system permease component